MNDQQIALVQESFKKVVPIKEAAADLFYGKLFELDPTTKPLFKGDIKEQGRKLMQTLAIVVNSLHQLPLIVPTVQDLAKCHVTYGVKNEHYATVGTALLWALEQGLGDDFTADVKAAWTAAYTLLAQVMQQAASEVEMAI